MNPITTVMRQCRLFDGIPEEKYQNVLACLRGETKLFRKDAILLQIGECQKRPGVVMDGTLRISLYSEDGNLVTIERLGRGQVFGETLVCSMAEDSPIQIDALTDVQLAVMSELPATFTTAEGVAIAGKCGMAERTFKKFLRDRRGVFFTRDAYGSYSKL